MWLNTLRNTDWLIGTGDHSWKLNISLWDEGAKSYRALASGLNERGITAARGGTWSSMHSTS